VVDVVVVVGVEEQRGRERTVEWWVGFFLAMPHDPRDVAAVPLQLVGRPLSEEDDDDDDEESEVEVEGDEGGEGDSCWARAWRE
jgi:hypothetical protein